MFGGVTDPDGDSLTVTDTAPQVGTYGTLIVDPSGNYTFVPNATARALSSGDQVVETFGYTVSDGNGGVATAEIDITIDGVDQAPGFDGKTLTYTYRISSGSTPFDLTRETTVGDGVELQDLVVNSFGTVDVSDDSVVVTFTESASWNVYAFNGFFISDA